MTMIIYPTKALNVGSVKAGLLKSFGFGQVGGEVLVLHPNILLGTLSRSAYEAYLKKRQARDAKAHRYTYEALIGQSQVAEDPKLIKLKTGPPFAADLESQAYLDPTVRASFNPVTGSWAITKANLDESKTSARQVPDLAKALFEAAGGERSGLGVDVQLVTDLPVDNQDFLQRNFTKAELEHCLAQPDVPSSLAGRWAAKEAVVKALCSVASSKPDWLGGPGAPLNAIEVLPGSPAPTVKFGPLIQSPPKVKVSISHSGEYAVAIATVMHV